MSSYAQQVHRAPTASEIHHALLRPAILQILRAQGYYSSTPSTVDALTELAANYLTAISRSTAQHAALNNEVGVPGLPDIVDVRLALEDCGALWPERDFTAQEVSGEEDMRGIDEFIRWAKGSKNRRIRMVAALDKPAAGDVGEEGVEEQRETDYLSALKRKHNKTDQDSKYAGTILGRGIVEGEVVPEGGSESSIHAWARKMHETSQRPPEPETIDIESRPPSSGLSSLADEDVAMIDMEF
ncbi:hypothetical protein F4815DRAFT_37945 [Daldinia loculata]|uniref:uncharacterized protein n=1 Tax=Daldinia loculata TaxID=103429 RepID=UPI0020C55CCF|nr:uncharacterized protein F4817DRAFT_314546 [Daldinia loculata]KAI1648583.1 hypothetical protein F4817DRAFT_314546 [Daldinia loculata]KAI2782408.1 hypothetical protein F4815DRAFT_37945 [Daldinia loculata]